MTRLLSFENNKLKKRPPSLYYIRENMKRRRKNKKQLKKATLPVFYQEKCDDVKLESQGIITEEQV